MMDECLMHGCRQYIARLYITRVTSAFTDVYALRLMYPDDDHHHHMPLMHTKHNVDKHAM